MNSEKIGVVKCCGSCLNASKKADYSSSSVYFVGVKSIPWCVKNECYVTAYNTCDEYCGETRAAKRNSTLAKKQNVNHEKIKALASKMGDKEIFIENYFRDAHYVRRGNWIYCRAWRYNNFDPITTSDGFDIERLEEEINK